MANIAEQMAAYTTLLREHKSAQDKPVTEITIFKLKEPQSAATLDYFETQIIANTTPGEGIKRQCWGFSLSDPSTFIWMLDWEVIQQHWDFWQTPAFLPVIQGINKLFVEGRPLVRHYEFQPIGMLQNSVQGVFVWNDEVREEKDGVAALTKRESRAKDRKDAYAVDMGEMSWRCVVLGYENEEDAKMDEFIKRDGLEAHLVTLKFAEQPN